MSFTQNGPNSKRVILTGATGFVGANLLRRLLLQGHQVHVLVRPNYHPWRIADLRDDFLLHEIHLEDANSIHNLIQKIQPDWIFHLAAHGAYSWQTNPQEIFQTNFLSTVNLIQACLLTGFEGFIHTGSSSEYGFKSHPASETDFLEPNSDYAVAKAAATQYSQFIAKHHKVNLSTLRLYSVYGPFEDPQRLFPALILKGLQGEYPPLANPQIARDFIYIDDVIDAYLLAITHPQGGEIYNVGSGIQTTLQDVVHVVRETFQITKEPCWGTMENRKWDTTVWVAQNEKIKTTLGWTPQISLREGIERMANWFTDCPEQIQQYGSLRNSNLNPV